MSRRQRRGRPLPPAQAPGLAGIERRRQLSAPVQGPAVPGGPLVDVVMPVFGEWEMAQQALAALPAAFEGLAEPRRVLIVDNGSPDRADAPGRPAKTAREAGDELRAFLQPGDGLFRLDENKGYPAAVNHAVSRGSAPLILILTADVVLRPGAATTLIREMDDPRIGVAGPKLLFPESNSPHGPPGSVQHAGVAFDIRGKPFHIFIAWRPDNPRVNVRREMAALTGACLVTRRSLWTQIGGFWEGYGKGTFEDMEYCFRVRGLGAVVIYAPEAVGYHLVSGARLQGAGRGFALPQNESLFRGRNAAMLAWDEWRYW